jgi:hypothetical protein
MLLVKDLILLIGRSLVTRIIILTVTISLTWGVTYLSMCLREISLAILPLLISTWRVNCTVILERTFLLMLLILLIHLLLYHVWILVVCKPLCIIRVTLIIPDSWAPRSLIPRIIEVVLCHRHFTPVSWTAPHIILLLIVMMAVGLYMILVNLIRSSSIGIIVPRGCVHVGFIIAFHLFNPFCLREYLLPTFDKGAVFASALLIEIHFDTLLLIMVVVIIALFLVAFL